MTGSSQTSHFPAPFGRMTGWRFLFIILGFFAVVFSANGALIYYAVSGFSGIETDNAFQKGRAYNEVLADMEAQKALGWTSQLTGKTVPMPAGILTRIELVMRDRAGAPVTGLKVHATMFRPVAAGADEDMEMTEGPAGSYMADFHLAYEGNWVARVAALGARGEKYAAEERVFAGAR